MTQYSNQFNLSNEKGSLTLANIDNVYNCKVDASESATLVPGDPVKIKDIAGSLITIEKADAATDNILGFVARSFKKTEYVALDGIQIASNLCVMNMEASAAIAAGADLEISVSTSKVATHAGTGSIIGKALEKAAADGDLIKVLIATPGKGAADYRLESVAYSAGAGALPLTAKTIFLTTGGAEALTLADGVAGQELNIVMVVDGGDGTLTPANYLNGTTLTFDDAGDSAKLVFDGTNWCNVGTPTATVA
jgi:hypothetical protein